MGEEEDTAELADPKADVDRDSEADGVIVADEMG